MTAIYKHEMKTYIKSLIIWSVCVGGMGLACILLFSSMQNSMEGMAENFAGMGAFSDAFGMNRLSIATLTGFYATEVGTIHTLGGAMFAAIISINMLSKEEDGHTSEFLFSLPVSRSKALTAKWSAVFTLILLFNLFCIGLYLSGVAILGEEIPLRRFFLYHMMQLFMHLEIAAVCYALSAFMKKSKFGIGLGMVLFLYAYDLMARVIPELSHYKAVTPFSFSNAADILSGERLDPTAVIIGTVIFLLGIITAYIVYCNRDLAP
ncbi:MAG: ABC transporter permease subunit [Lachnospiraceae bacterium]|nr:ABC transporter permease subunit [Lachnospiraceae bacterium]